MSWKIPVLATVVVVLLSSSAYAQATTQRTELHMVIAASDAELDRDLTAAADTSLLSTYAQSPRAVRLEETVTLGKAMSASTIEAGTILFGRYDDTVWTFCAIDKYDAAGQIADAIIVGIFTGGLSLLDGSPRSVKCLHDADNDGVFESAWWGGETKTENAFLAFSLSPHSLSSRVKYTEVDYREGPRMPATIDWSKNKKTGTVAIKTTIGGLDLKNITVPIPTPGGDPEDTNILGGVIKVTGYDPDTDVLSYRITDNTQNQYALIPAVLTITTSYTYY